MQFDFLEKLQEVAEEVMNKVDKQDINIDGSNVTQTEVDLAKKLNAIEEFSIDRFEDNIAVLENRENGKIIQVEKDKLPSNVKEGDILKSINGKYILDEQRTMEETNRLKDKMNKLWD